MTSRERMRRTLTHQPVDRAPRDLWTVLGMRMFYGQEFKAMLERFPRDMTDPDARYGVAKRTKGTIGVRKPRC
jgi:hypothetical protein